VSERAESPTATLIRESLEALVRQRDELRSLYRRFAAIGKADLADALLRAPGEAISSTLDMMTAMLAIESDERAGRLSGEEAREKRAAAIDAWKRAAF
jgi:hypothetical protein